MAEFKLDRFKYSWKGDWTTGTDYKRDDIVRVGGKSYVCIVTHIAASNFYVDLLYTVPGSNPPVPDPKWVVMTSGSSFVGNWTIGNAYNLGDIVFKDGTLWKCTGNVASATTWATDESKFELFSAHIKFMGAWTTGTDYGKGALVRYNGIVYKCITSHTSQAALEDDQASWEVFFEGVEFVGDYAGATKYNVNDLVRYGGSIYRCTVGHTSSSLNPDVMDLTKFTVEYPGYQWEKDWDYTKYYQTGDVVRQRGYVYYCVNSNIDSEPSIADSSTNWLVLAYGYYFKGDWSPTGFYRPGDVVSRGGDLYVAKTQISGGGQEESTLDYVNSDYWDVLAKSQSWAKENNIIYYRVTVGPVNDQLDSQTGDHRFVIDGSYKPALVFEKGATYVFVQDDPTNAYYPNTNFGDVNNVHPLNFSSNSANGPLTDGGNYYTTHVHYYLDNVMVTRDTYNTLADFLAATYRRVEIMVHADTPTQLYYFCDKHLNMGNSVTVIAGKTGEWQLGKEYRVNEVVYHLGNAYKNNTQHIADNNNYPGDNGSGYVYWDLLVQAGQPAGMNTRGDLLTFNLNRREQDDGSSFGNTNVPIGRKEQLLSVDSNDTVFWRDYIHNADVVYVDTNGVDDAENGYGLSYYKPFKTVRYALEFVEDNFDPLTPVKVAVATGRFTEICPMTVPAGCVVMGDELRSTTIEANQPLTAYANDTDKAQSYFDYLSTIIFDVLNNNPIVSKPGNTFTQNLNAAPAVGTGVTPTIVNLTTDIMQYINFYVNSTGLDVTVIGTNTLNADTNFINGATILLANKKFLAKDMIEHIKATFPAYVFEEDRMMHDILAFLRGIAYDMKYPGNYKSILAARRYSNAATGSQLEDMFWCRDVTGVRNCTLEGLKGNLNPPGVYELYQRPTGKSFCSLDPGWGPADNRTWINTRSPYLQGVTNIGTSCIGKKVDGALHNGGNKSMVSNDFTQVISDGVGAWVLNNGRAELVSVFTYYCAVGYLADKGGIIRATNGNNSYGKYGAVADGIDASETPQPATVDNRNNEAQVRSVFAGTFSDEIFAFEYQNAGQDYTNASATITGAGANASVEFTDFRDNAMFEARIVNPPDSGAAGGLGYSKFGNNAQSGNTTSIQLATAESFAEADILGLRIIITAGDGTGQYGYVTGYTPATRQCTVSKESTGQPGWDHVLSGKPIASSLTTNTQYVLEPRITFSSPGFADTSASLPGTNNIVDATYGETTLTFTDVEGTLGSGTTDDQVTPAAAKFNIIKSGKNYAVTVSDAGAGYALEDTITIAGTDLGGASPANDLTIIVKGITDDSTNAITSIYSSGKGVAGKFVVFNDANNVYTSDDGVNWSGSTVSASGSWKRLISGGNRFVAIRFAQGDAYSSNNGTVWTQRTMPESANWSDIAYGGGKFVVVAEGSNTVAYSATGESWSSATMPADDDSTFTQWQGVAYGNGKFVAIGSNREAAYSSDGLTWTRVNNALPVGDFYNWVGGLTFGKGKFLAIANTGDVVYSFDGQTWYNDTMPTQDGSTQMNWKSCKYEQGMFFATCDTGNQVIGADPTTGETTFTCTSEDGVHWTGRNLSAQKSWVTSAHGNPNGVPIHLLLAGGAGSDAVAILDTGCTAKGRADLSSAGKFNAIKIWDPGSGYSTAPTLTVTDPKTSSLTLLLFTTQRLGDGVLGQPSFVNSGIGYRSATTTVAVSGDGFADIIPGDVTSGSQFVTLQGVTTVPGPGAQLLFSTIPDTTTADPDDLKIFNAVVITDLGDDGSGLNKKRIRCQISPNLEIEDDLQHDTALTIRERYSQCRISGHDFLDIGTGNFETTNYPDIYAGGAFFVASPENEVLEQNGGRVFYTSTDQSGNFRAGELFAVEQATGIVTISAQFFDLDGLSELALGGVRLGGSGAVIKEFSTDPFFSEDSNNVIPTQRAIATFLANRLSVGGSDLETNQIIAGRIRIGGPQNVINTTIDTEITVPTLTTFEGASTSIAGSLIQQIMLLRQPFDVGMQ